MDVTKIPLLFVDTGAIDVSLSTDGGDTVRRLRNHNATATIPVTSMRPTPPATP